MRQLGVTYTVYPSANHTRFEHSIGVYYLAGKVINILKEKQPELNIDDNGYMCHNRLTRSVYQEFNVGFDDEYILLDVKLGTAVLIQINFFGEYEKEQLLST